jgi:hypothetical protein
MTDILAPVFAILILAAYAAWLAVLPFIGLLWVMGCLA